MFVGYFVILIIAAVISLWGKKTATQFKVYLWVCVAFESANHLLINAGSRNTLFLLNIYSICQICYFIFEFLDDYRRFYLKIGLIAVFGLCAMVNYFFIQGPYTINTYTYNPGMLLVVILIIMYLNHLIFKTDVISLVNIPKFWLSVGIFLFYASAFPVLVFSDAMLMLEDDIYADILLLITFANYFLSTSYLMYVLVPWMKKN